MSAPGSSSSIPFKSKKPLLMDSPSTKSQSGIPDPSSVAVQTPQKPPENMSNRSINRSLPVKEKLPEKYEILGKFFDALDSSISLLRLRGSKPTFSNVSGKIERLTERRFSYSHLAQLKHILPEAIEITRVLIHDATTSCMIPDLHVTLNADPVESNVLSNSECKKILLRQVFKARLAEFVQSHPQGDEVPEEPIPELFTRRKLYENSNVKVKRLSSAMEEMASIPVAKLISSPIKVPSTPVKPASSPPEPTLATLATPVKPVTTNTLETPVKPVTTTLATPVKPVTTNTLATPVKPVTTTLATPVKPVTTTLANVPESVPTPAQLYSSTSLAARRQKRSSGCSDSDDVSTNPPTKPVRRALSLNFDSHPEEIDQVPNDVSRDDEILSILPDKLRQSLKEQEKKAMEGQNPAISLAKRRRKMITYLPKLFNVIHYLIQSIRRWVITKEELVHKIIAGHSDITDRKEVEEQLLLMQELVPEWMSEKISSSGDLLICINKLASPETIRLRLEEENKLELVLLLS